MAMEPGRLGKYLAIASPIIPLVGSCLRGPVTKALGPVAAGPVFALFFLVGLGCGIVAIALGPRKRGVLAPAIAGIVLCSLMTVMFVAGVVAAGAQSRKQRDAPPHKVKDTP